MRITRILTAHAAALCVLVVVGAVANAGADPAARQPIGVTQASLVQDGQKLVWQAQFDRRFSLVGLRHGGRSLCLLIERASNGTVSGTLCVRPTEDARRAALVYQRSSERGGAPSHPISATITRSGGNELTARFSPRQIGNSYRSIRWQILSTLRPPMCTPPAPNILGCTTVFPSRPALARLHTPRLVGCVPSGAPYVTNGLPSRRVVALTFDDGPWPDTPQFLDILERNHVHATFFQIGEHVGIYGGAVDRRMLADGDMIGDHTWDHVNVAAGGPLAAAEISRTATAIRQMTGFTPCLFRAPGGAVGPALISRARSMGFTTIQWNVDPRDWARPGTEAIYSNVIANARNGSIIIQHDGGGDRSQTLAALPREIATLRANGFRFVTITQLLGQRLIYK